MGRAGGGGGRSGGGGRPGGAGRSGGGHSSSGFGRTGGSGRAGSGGFGSGSPGNMGNFGAPGSMRGSGSRGGMGGPGSRGGMGGPDRRMGPPPGGRRNRFFGFWPFRRFGGGYYRGGGCSGCLIVVIVFILAVIFIPAFTILHLGSNNNESRSGQISESTSNSSSSNSSSSSGSAKTSDTTRKKIDSDMIFDSDCILDELDWVENIEITGESLEDFFDATGIQPYVYFKAYDETLSSDSEKGDFAQDWYEENIDNEYTFLFIYFAEEDTDNDVGYMYYVCGYNIESVMDEEACEIFWDYVDEYWYSSLSTDDMLTEIFNSTADAIM